MTNAMKLNKMNDGELNIVVGGTVKEFEELLSAFSDNPILKGAAKLDAHTPGANTLAARLIRKELLKMGLEADIDLGWGGTGIGSDPNKYRLNGNRISHKEACDYIRNYAC